MKPALIIFGLAIAACSGPPPPIPCMRRLSPTPPGQVPVVLVGAALKLEMRLSPVVTCPGADPAATEAVATVLNPLNQPVLSSASPPVSDGDYTTNVTFSPKMEGVYSVIVRFEPGLGSTQREVQVVRDRTREGALTTFTPRRPCGQIAKVGQAYVCAAGLELDVYRDGGLAETLVGHGLAPTAGPVAWTWAGNTVTRLEDSDGGLLQVTTVADGGVEPQNAVNATPTHLASLVNSTLTEVVFDGGALEVARSTTGLSPPSATTGLLMLPGDVFAWGAADGKMCVLSLAPMRTVSCTPAVLEVDAADGEVLWFRGLMNNDVGVLRILTEARQPTITTLTARPPALVDAKQAVPAFRWDSRLVLGRPADLALESWRVGSSTPLRFGIAPGVVWLQSADDNEVSVFAR